MTKKISKKTGEPPRKRGRKALTPTKDVPVIDNSMTSKEQLLFGHLPENIRNFVRFWTFNGNNINRAMEDAGYSKGSYEYCRTKIRDKDLQAYSEFLKLKAATAGDNSLTCDEVIDNTREIYDEAMEAGKLKEALEATKMLAMFKGMLSGGGPNSDGGGVTSNTYIQNNNNGIVTDSLLYSEDASKDIQRFKEILNKTLQDKYSPLVSQFESKGTPIVTMKEILVEELNPND